MITDPESREERIQRLRSTLQNRSGLPRANATRLIIALFASALLFGYLVFTQKKDASNALILEKTKEHIWIQGVIEQHTEPVRLIIASQAPSEHDSHTFDLTTWEHAVSLQQQFSGVQLIDQSAVLLQLNDITVAVVMQQETSFLAQSQKLYKKIDLIFSPATATDTIRSLFRPLAMINTEPAFCEKFTLCPSGGLTLQKQNGTLIHEP